MFKIRKIRKRELILALIWLIIMLIISFGSGIRGIYLKFKRLESEISTQEEKLYRLQVILAQKQQVEEGYKKTASLHQGFRESYSLLQEIEDIASLLRLNLITLKPSQVEDEDAYKTYAIRMEFQDDPVTIIKFCHLLTERLANIGIERIQIKTPDNTKIPKTSISLKAVVFKK